MAAYKWMWGFIIRYGRSIDKATNDSSPSTPQELATPEAFARNPSRVWEFYHYRRELMMSKHPNPAHTAIAECEARLSKQGRSVVVITQNIDELHRKAGTRHLLEIHGKESPAVCYRYLIQLSFIRCLLIFPVIKTWKLKTWELAMMGHFPSQFLSQISLKAFIRGNLLNCSWKTEGKHVIAKNCTCIFPLLN